MFVHSLVPETKPVHKSPSELLSEHRSSLPCLGRGAKSGDHIDLFSPTMKPPPSLAKVCKNIIVHCWGYGQYYSLEQYFTCACIMISLCNATFMQEVYRLMWLKSFREIYQTYMVSWRFVNLVPAALC